MKRILKNLKLKYDYFSESIKNRYPCKIISIENKNDFNKPCVVTFRYVTRLNIRKSTLQQMLDDSMLIEKFHPTDCIKLGFLAASEILVNEKTDTKIKKIYIEILEKMFK